MKEPVLHIRAKLLPQDFHEWAIDVIDPFAQELLTLVERNVLFGDFGLGDRNVVSDDQVTNGRPLLCAAVSTIVDVVDRARIQVLIKHDLFLHTSALNGLLVIAYDVWFVHDGLLEPRVTRD